MNGTAPGAHHGFDLSGRVAVVTGAAGTLGPLWVRTLLDAGAQVAALIEPGTEPGTALTALARSPRVVVLEADVTVRADLELARDQVAAEFGTAHILVANAGRDHPPTSASAVRLAALKSVELRGIIDTNITGTLLSVSVFGGAMVAAGRGSVILIGSQYSVVAPDPRLYDHLGGDEPFVKNPAYGASKAAVANLARYFATHWGRAGVRVNTLSPGGVRGGQDPQFVEKFTQRVPLGRMLDADELAGPLVFLAGDASSYVTGTNLVVDGGYGAW